MKTTSLLLLFTAFFAAFAHAQNPDSIVVFGGFSRLGYGIYADYSGPWISAPLNGFEISGAFSPVRHFGAEVDFAHGYSPSNHWSSQTFMGGPRFSANIDGSAFSVTFLLEASPSTAPEARPPSLWPSAAASTPGSCATSARA